MVETNKIKEEIKDCRNCLFYNCHDWKFKCHNCKVLKHSNWEKK